MTALVSLLFIVMIPTDCKITNFSLRLLYIAFQDICVLILISMLPLIHQLAGSTDLDRVQTRVKTR